MAESSFRNPHDRFFKELFARVFLQRYLPPDPCCPFCHWSFIMAAVAENFRALFKTPVELEPYLPEYGYLLYDLNRYQDEALQETEILRAPLLLLKYIFRRELKDMIYLQ